MGSNIKLNDSKSMFRFTIESTMQSKGWLSPVGQRSLTGYWQRIYSGIRLRNRLTKNMKERVSKPLDSLTIYSLTSCLPLFLDEKTSYFLKIVLTYRKICNKPSINNTNQIPYQIANNWKRSINYSNAVIRIIAYSTFSPVQCDYLCCS